MNAVEDTYIRLLIRTSFAPLTRNKKHYSDCVYATLSFTRDSAEGGTLVDVLLGRTVLWAVPEEVLSRGDEGQDGRGALTEAK